MGIKWKVFNLWDETVRNTLLDRDIPPESLPAGEDVKKVERRLKADEKNPPKEEKAATIGVETA